MKVNKLVTFAILLIIIQIVYSRVGTTGLQFLKIGVGARACGMGEAYTSLSDDASGIYWNPAGMGSIDHKEFLFMHNEWLLDTRFEFLSIALPLAAKLSLGFAITYFSYGDIEGRDELGYHLPDFSAYDFAFSLSLAATLWKNLHGGLTQKLVQSKIESQQGRGVLYDVGILYQTPGNGLRIGLVGQNLGKDIKFIEEGTKPPAALKCGISSIFQLSEVNLTPAVDVSLEVNGNRRTNTGLELNLMDRIFLRGGYKFGVSPNRLTAGFGIVQKVTALRISIDYAYGDYDDLGMSHRISIGIEF